jgi:hypothetical protein
MGVNVGQLIEYSRVFPDVNDSVSDLLKGIPKDILLKAGTAFLAHQTLDHKSTLWSDIIATWFNYSNLEQKQIFVERVLNNYQKKEISRLNMFAPITSLKVLQLGFEKIDDENQKSRNQIEVDLLKIHLLLNESFAKQQIESTDYIEHTYPELFLGLLLLNMIFSTSDITNFIIDREFFCQSVKAMFLGDFIQRDNLLKTHLARFLDKYGVKSIEEYSARVLGILKPISRKENEGFIELSASTEDDKEFIKKMSVQEYSPTDDVDFKIVRSFPLIQLGENSFRITHPLFCSDKLYKSIYFDLSAINELVPADGKINDFRRYYTSNFSEKYLLYEVLGFCLKKRYIQFTGEEIDKMGIQGAPDYYVRNGKYIFLVENKDVLIKASVKESSVFENLEVELKKKFLRENNGRAVGINQIINNIERVLLKTNAFDTNYKINNIVIFPILIVHDIVYDCPGLNQMFNKWFNEEIARLKAKNLPIQNVKPLVVLNIDTLIRSSGLLRLNKIGLAELCETFYKNQTIKKKKFKSEEELEDALTQTYLPSTKVIEDWLYSNHKGFLQSNQILEYALNKMKSN